MSSLGKRKSMGAASQKMKRARAVQGLLALARPRTRTPKGKFEGVRRGVAVSGSSGPEIKQLDINVSNTAVVTGTPYIASMTAAIAEGTDSNDRIGIKILLKSLDLQLDAIAMVNAGIATPSTTTGTSPGFMDVFVVWDKQPNGAVPTVATIFANTTTPLTFGNVGQLDRFVVLRRRRFSFDGSKGLSETMTEHVPLELATRFADATASPNTNDIYIVALCNNAAGAGTINGGIAYSARIKFVDA